MCKNGVPCNSHSEIITGKRPAIFDLEKMPEIKQGPGNHT